MDQDRLADIQAKKAALEEELKTMKENKANDEDIASVQALVDALAKDEEEVKKS